MRTVEKREEKTMSIIRDISLAKSGHDKINWVKSYMPVLRSIEEEFREKKPFEGKKIAMSIHLEAKTAYLATVLRAGGAEVYSTGCNPVSYTHLSISVHMPAIASSIELSTIS